MRQRLYALLALFCVLAAATVGANAAAGANAPATTAVAPATGTTPCSDVTIHDPTPVHLHPADTSYVLKNLPSYYEVRGTCSYWDNEFFGQAGHWFMLVALGTGGYGYIWVQRLMWGSSHHCNDNGDILDIPANCPLHHCYTRSCSSTP
jgi:hypothetical protein